MSNVVCETSNATVASICCAQLGIPLTTSSTTETIVPQSTPIPTGVPTTTCEWSASSNTTAAAEIQSWLSCTRQYANTTVNSVCMTPATLSSDAHSIKVKHPTKYISIMVLVGMIVQMALAVE